jgi:GT2 family glycosyltransferase
VQSEYRISVVIPVYNAADELEGCLRSVQATTTPGTEILVIDDASPDPAVRELLQAWSRAGHEGWRFFTNETNLGFVGTANRGMRLAGADVVLLNSDTVVTPGWLEGLQRCLKSDPRIATATPWTNNGEIASIPDFCRVNPVPSQTGEVARVIAGTGQATYPELPTAVGFCMAIARRAIDRIGLFDEALFGKGYGEENDFSMRALAAGMRNVLCDDVYVAHLGGRSFGPLGLKPDEGSMKRLLSRHPGYLETVQAFIRDDPLAARREEVVSAIERAGVRLG